MTDERLSNLDALGIESRKKTFYRFADHYEMKNPKNHSIQLS